MWVYREFFRSADEVIKGHVENRSYEDAEVVYVEMLELGFPVSEFRYFSMLIKAFGGFGDVSKVREIHGHVLKFGILGDVYDVNALLGVYWKCGAVGDAHKVFDKMSERDLVSWNTMISGFCHSGDYVRALMMFSRMVRDHHGVLPTVWSKKPF